jgi:superoxide dismutase, Fe-Mn family
VDLITNKANYPAYTNLKKHVLPPLEYDYAALAPYIDYRTMVIHHDHHHGNYVKKLNEALEKHPEFQAYSALWLLLNLNKLPEKIRLSVHHNAGGHVNHSMYWRAMSPVRTFEPKGLFREAIDQDFGSLAKLKSQFIETGANLFGSGWVWLTRTRDGGGKLEIISTHGHDHPMMQNRFPVLLNDVWEHAYYSQYENRRDDYLNRWWSVVDWDQATRCFERSDRSIEQYLYIEDEPLISQQASLLYH